MLAQTYLRQGNRLRAEQTAQEAARLAEDNAAIQLGAGNMLISIGKSREALPYLNAATELAPGSLGAWFNLARAHLSLDQSIDARRALKKALEIDADDLRSQITMALIEMGDGNTDKALQIAANLKALYPESAAPMNLEADIYFAEQQFEKATDLYRQAFEVSPSATLARRAFQAARSAGREDAAATLESWLADHPDDATTTMFLAQENQRRGGSSNAIALYERVLDGDPDNFAVLNNLAWIYNEEGDSKKAETLARRAYELRPDIGSVADTLGWILLRRGNVEEAAAFIEEAAKKSPRSRDIQYHLAYVRNEIGRTAESRDILRSLLATEDDFDERENAEALLAEIEGQ
jgi:putative PEP-CTERM system TPR-repeat lipoprotein